MMIKIIEKLAQKIKNNPRYELDRQLQFLDLNSILFQRVFSIIRALFVCVLLKKCHFPLFIGKRVRILHTRHISIGRGVTIDDYVKIDALSKKGVVIGDNVSIGAFTIIETTGILTNLGQGFSIGKNSNLGDYNYVGAAGGVIIGENVLIGQRVSFHSENHVFEKTDIPIREQGTTQQGIVVEDDCWLGSGVTILDGVTVHKGSVIAAGSVVTKSVPPYSVVGGVPAKLIQTRQ